MKIGDKGLARDSKVSLCPFYFPITSFSNKNPGRSDPCHFQKKMIQIRYRICISVGGAKKDTGPRVTEGVFVFTIES